MNRMRWAVASAALLGVAACGTQGESTHGDGLGTSVPTASSTPTASTDRGPDRYTPPTGECGVTLICGLGAGPDGPVTTP